MMSRWLVVVAQFKKQACAFLLFFAFPHCSVLDGSKTDHVIKLFSYSTVEVDVGVSLHCIEEGRSSHNSANEGESESKKINRLNSLENGSRLRDGNGFNIFILTTSRPSATTTSFAGYSIKMAKDEEVDQSNKQFILLDLLMRYRSIFIRGHHYHGSHRFRSEYSVIDHEQPVGAPFGIYCHLNTRKYK